VIFSSSYVLEAGKECVDLIAVICEDILTSPFPFLTEFKDGALGARSPSINTPIDRSATPTPASMAAQKGAPGSSGFPAGGAAAAGGPSSNALASSTGAPISRSGLLVIRVIDAKGLSLPQGVSTPPAIARAITQSRTSSSFATSFVNGNGGNRQSMQRKNCWWLPYMVLEFDKNEVLIDAMGGDVQGPTWMYKATLWVFSVSM
jgi:serum/glucocorticoid-regulated kinase 2